MSGGLFTSAPAPNERLERRVDPDRACYFSVVGGGPTPAHKLGLGNVHIYFVFACLKGASRARIEVRSSFGDKICLMRDGGVPQPIAAVCKIVGMTFFFLQINAFVSCLTPLRHTLPGVKVNFGSIFFCLPFSEGGGTRLDKNMKTTPCLIQNTPFSSFFVNRKNLSSK